MPVQAKESLSAAAESTTPLRVDREFSARALVHVSGTWTGTLRVLAGMPDGSQEIVASESLRSGVRADGITANGLYTVDASGFQTISVEAETLTTGPVSVQVVLVIG